MQELPKDKPPAHNAKVTKTNFAKAVVGSKGIYKVIAERIGCGRWTMSKFIRRNWDFCRPLLEEERDDILDLAEAGLISALHERKDWAIKYTLSNIGQRRGWNTQQTLGEFEEKKDIQTIQADLERYFLEYDNKKSVDVDARTKSDSE